MRAPKIPKLPGPDVRVFDLTLRLSASERDALKVVSARLGTKTLQEALRKLIFAAVGEERAA